jgi:NHLM bacteriocin system ABC transporter peptidase/ATP-binding protein
MSTAVIDAADVAIKPRAAQKPVVTPTVLQMEQVECGAAALSIILSYYGRYVLLEELRTACGVSRDGSKASNIVKAARSYGLLGKGYKREPGEVREATLPVIVFWNFNHFLVVEGFKDGRVYLNDPAYGRRNISDEEFDAGFTGVLLAFEKSAEFKAEGRSRSPWQSIARRLKGSRRALTFIILAALGLVTPVILLPVFTKVFIDQLIVNSLYYWLEPMLWLMFAMMVIAGVLTWLQQSALLRLQTRLAVTSSAKFLWHVLRLPMEFFAQRFPSEISGRVEVNEEIAALLSSGVTTNVVNLMMIGFFAVLMFLYDAKLTLFGILAVILNLVVLRHFTRARKNLTQRLLQEESKCTGLAMTGLQMMETLKSTGSENGFFARWSGHQAKVINAEQKLSTSMIVYSMVPQVLVAMSAVAVLYFGGLRVMSGVLTIGMLWSFLALMEIFLEPASSLIELGGTLQEMDGSLARLDDVLRYPVSKQFHAHHAAIAGAASVNVPVKLEGSVELRHVTFGYSRLDPPLIRDFNLKVKPGSRIAIVGATGSGKSTLSKLIAGLYEPWEGEILFDGVPRAHHPPELLHNSIALVDQEVVLFEATVRENLTLWDGTVDEAVMVEAAKDACIHSDISARHGGYNSVIEESGRDLSGGQRQRVEIARALTIQPRILILDEATSGLDPHTEKMVDDNLHRRGCTVIVIAHRLSTIRDCDEILVLQKGTVVQRGTHEELIASDGAYRALLSMA